MKCSKKLLKIIFGTVLVIIVLPILFVSGVILTDSILHPDEIPSFFGWKPFIVITNSMKGTIDAGDIVIVKECSTNEIGKGDVVSYLYDKKSVITHRIVSVNTEGSDYYIFKGDNNELDDGWKVYPYQIEGKFKFRIRRVGYVALFVQTPTGIIVCMIIPVAILFVLQLIEDIRNPEEEEETEKKKE